MTGFEALTPSLTATAIGAAGDALAVAVASQRASDALATVTVVTPNRYVALARRRHLARRLGGLLDVHFLTLPALVDRLGAPTLRAAARVPATPAVRAEALRALLATSDGPLAAVRHHLGARAAIDKALAEIATLPESARRSLAQASPLTAELVELDTRMRRRLARWYDSIDQLGAATESVTDGGVPADLGHVIIFLPRPANLLEGALLRALHHAGAHLIVGFTGDATADSGSMELVHDLTDGHAITERSRATEAPLVDVVVAPDPDGEARAAVQRVVSELATGMPLHRMAIVTRLPAPYARAVRERLRDANIPWSGPADRTLANTAAGRVLGGLLDVCDGWLRNSFAAWCSGAPVLETRDGVIVPAHRFDVLSRRAGVVHGLDQWRERVPTFVAQSRARAHDLANDPEASEGRATAAATDASDAERLAAFIERVAALATPPASSRWADHAAWARHILEELVAPNDTWPDDDVRAAEDLAARIDALGALDAVGSDCNHERFRAALEHELATPLGPIGRFGDGVFVGTLQSMAGLDFDLVVVVGANDRELPPTRRDDPLLPDAVRRLAGGALRTHDERAADERHDWLATLHSGARVLVTTSRADTRAMRERRPARWLLELVEARVSRPVGADDLDEIHEPWCRVVPSFSASIIDAPAFADAVERDLASAALAPDALQAGTHPLTAARPELGRRVAAVRARLLPEFSEFDGLVGALDHHLATARPFSPTALEQYARCPRSYLFAKVLRLDEVPRPETIDELAPIERGSLVHKALEQFVERSQPFPPGHTWSAADRERLVELGLTLLAEYEGRGLTGRRVPSTIAQRTLTRDLRDWIDRDNTLRSQHGVVPMLVEHAFGFDDVAPVVIDIEPGRAIKLRGRIDRIDLSPDGSRALVVDYKTGRAGDFKELAPDNAVGSGEHLQLPVYARAAAAATGATSVTASFMFVSRNERVHTVGYTVDEAVLEQFDAAVRVIANGIDTGAFPGRPGKEDTHRRTFANCRRCPFDRICPTSRAEEWVRVHSDARLGDYRKLTGDAAATPTLDDDAPSVAS
ncbi:MAG: PD-(D/E)XK nuclease family protein [Acidimicrobiia bacterium]